MLANHNFRQFSTEKVPKKPRQAKKAKKDAEKEAVQTIDDQANTMKLKEDVSEYEEIITLNQVEESKELNSK